MECLESIYFLDLIFDECYKLTIYAIVYVGLLLTYILKFLNSIYHAVRCGKCVTCCSLEYRTPLRTPVVLERSAVYTNFKIGSIMTKKQIEITLFILSTILFAVGIYLSISIESHQKTIYWIAALLSTVGAVGPSAVDKLSFGNGGRVKSACYTPEKRLQALASVKENPTGNDNEVLKKLTFEADGRSGAERGPEDYLLFSTRALRSGFLEEALRYAYWGLYREDADKKVKAALAYRLGSVFIELGDDLLAVEKLLVAIELDPALSCPHTSLGLLYEKMGKNDDAERAYKEALRLEPGVESHQSNLKLYPDDGGVQFDPEIVRQGKTGQGAKDEVDSLANEVLCEPGLGRDVSGAEGAAVAVQEKRTKETGEASATAAADDGVRTFVIEDTLQALEGSIYDKDFENQEDGVSVDDSQNDGLPEVKNGRKEDEPASIPAEALIVEPHVPEASNRAPLEEEKDEPLEPGDKETADGLKKDEVLKAGGEGGTETPSGEEDKDNADGETSEYAFRKTAAKEPRDCIDQYNLGLLYQRMGKLEEAEKAYREALILDPAYVKTHNNLGLLYQRMGRDEEAQVSYTEALRLDPAFSWAYSNLGSLYKKMGKYEEAEKAYREALRLDPSDAIAEYNLGLLYQALGRNDESEKAYVEALRLEPNYVKVHFNLGNLYKKMGKKGEAELSYREALRIEPNDASAQYNLGLLYHSMERYDDAEESYMAALTINPEYIKSHNNLGILYEKMNRQSDAERSYKRAIALDPNYVKARNNLALLHKKMSQAVLPQGETGERRA